MRGAVAPVAALFLCVASGASGAEDAPYLATDQVPDALAILPPPPAPESAAAKRDRAIYRRTRALAGGARWRMASEDVENAPLDRYACAMGMALTPQSAPTLAHLLDKVGTGAMIDPVKAHYAVPRPFIGNPAPICQPRSAGLAANGDYPSGHAANGWLEGLVLAQLLPDRATPILARARAYGESRAVCGAHSLSAVEAGWMAGTVMFAALQSSPGYRHDLKAARQELSSIGASAPLPDAAQCAVQARVLAQRPW